MFNVNNEDTRTKPGVFIVNFKKKKTLGFLTFSEGIERNIGPKWVNILQSKKTFILTLKSIV